MKYTPTQYAKTLRSLVDERPRERREVIHEFAQMLARQNALSLLPDIIREFEQEKFREKKIKQVTVYTPARESESQWKTKLGAKTEVRVQSDVRLTGGVVLESGDVRVDNSIKMRMERIRQALIR